MENFQVEWDEGMSVGIKAIDDDHKHLLVLISQLLSSIKENNSETLRLIFDQLMEYIQEHFKREEDLMRRCHYANMNEHVAGHKLFIKKIPELKGRLHDNDSREVAEEIAVFLLNWLTNHILHDDLDLMEPAYRHGLLKNNPLYEDHHKSGALSRWIALRLSLPLRTRLTSLVPIIGVFFLASVILSESLKSWEAALFVQNHLETIQQTNSLIHHLQVERGLAAGLLSSKFENFVEELAAQKRTVDSEKAKTIDRLINVSNTTSNQRIKLNSQRIISQLRDLNQLRQSITSNAISTFQSTERYSKIIQSLQRFPQLLAQIKMDNALSGYVQVFITLGHLKELAGLERAFGASITQPNGNLNTPVFFTLVGKQIATTEILLDRATEDAQARWTEISTASEFQKVEILRSELTQNLLERTPLSVHHVNWFTSYTNKINLLKIFSDEISLEIKERVNQTVKRMRRKFYITLLSLLLLSLATIALSQLLTSTINRPIRRITDAMTGLSKGSCNVRIFDEYSDDDIRALVNSYEYCRRQILQGRFAGLIANLHQNTRLRRMESDKQKFKALASTDPLTGAFNRRRFFDLASRELLRSVRYNRDTALMIMDLDHFKVINDTFGHDAGDKVLATFTKTCLSIIRNTDIFARFGGEEFVIMLPETNIDLAKLLAERIRKTISELKINHNYQEITLTVSIGVCPVLLEKGLEYNIKCADTALYTAKDGGRNRIECFKHIP